MRTQRALAAIAVALLLNACEGGDASSSAEGECSVEVSGTLSDSWTSEQRSDSVVSDYWEDEEFLANYYEFLDNGTDRPSFEEVQESGEPILAALIFNCNNDANTLQLSAPDGTTLHDIPYGPGSYPIALNQTDPGARFTPAFTLEAEDDPIWRLSDDGGTLEIEEWTDNQLTGTFTFEIDDSFSNDNPRTATVTGTFDFHQ